MPLPACTGRYHVGCVDVLTRPSEIPTDLDDPFEVCSANVGSLIRLFYPCVDTVAKYKHTKWIPEPNQSFYTHGLLKHMHMGSWAGWLCHFFIKNHTSQSFANAPLLDHDMWQQQQPLPSLKERSKLPLVVFSHGLAANRGMYSVFCTELASQGYVVAAVEHRDSSASSSFIINAKNETIEIPYHVYHTKDNDDEEMLKLRRTQLLKRTREISEALDVLEKINKQPDDIENLIKTPFDIKSFQSRLNTENVFMMGHSFGGATTLNALKHDRRLKCGIGLDVWFVPLSDDFYEKNKETEKPVFLINTELFNWKQNLQRCNTYINNTTEDKIELITLKGTEHYDQCDVPGVIPTFMHPWFHTKKIAHRLPFSHSVEEQRYIIYDFFKKYLSNDDKSIVNLLKDYDLPDAFIKGSNIQLDDGDEVTHIVDSDVK